MRVVRLEPGHEWHGKYAVLPNGTREYRVPVLVRPILVNGWDDVGVAHIDTSYEVQRWDVVRLPYEVAHWYRSDFALIGPAMRLLSRTGSWPRPIPGVW